MNHLKRFLLRFGIVYLSLYALASTLPNSFDLENFAPVRALIRLAVWLGERLLGLADILTEPTGSGDRTLDWLTVGLLLGVSLIATVIWSALTRQKRHPLALEIARIILRYSVAITMLTYGFIKLFPMQFPPPGGARLFQSFGDASPMGLLWTLMGVSRGYQVFGGAAECLGGLLLLSRRTTLLGSLVSFGVMLHVFALNVFYDVPVKLLSGHLVVTCAFLALPDLGRLIDLFVLQRDVPATTWRFPAQRPWVRRAAEAARLLICGYLAWSFWGMYQERQKAHEFPLAGTWETSEFFVDGVPSTSDRWERIEIRGSQNQIYVAVLQGAKRRRFGGLGVAPPGAAFLIDWEQRAAYLARLTQPSHDALELEITIAGRTLRLLSKRYDTSKMLLLSRGFHWVSEVPFNR